MMPIARGVPSRPVEGHTIPFDYVFEFNLKGRADAAHSRTVAVSIEGSFTATSIGYGIVADERIREFGPQPGDFSTPPGIKGPRLVDLTFGGLLAALGRALREDPKRLARLVGPRTEAVLQSGLRLNPRFAQAAIEGGGTELLDASILGRLFEATPVPSEEIQFLYAIRDEASGREFQSEAVLSTAGLGIATGERPFRQFARPMTFLPRSAIRMDVTELATTFKGRLHVSLHGYKVLGAGAV